MEREKFNYNKLPEKTERVLADFNYEAVHKYMVEKNHTWHGENVPAIENLKVTARRLMTHALDEVCKTGHSFHTGTGGLNVYIFTAWNGVKLTYEPIEFKCNSY